MAELAPIIVDARGHHCPVPTLRLARALRAAAPGQIARLLADDPMAKIDVPHFLAQNGHRLLGSRVQDGVAVFEAERGS